MRREGFLAYGAQQTIQCVRALEDARQGLLPDQLFTVEQMLAAAHRLQTCLTLFAKGYPTPRVALWKRRLRRMVRALNALRDSLRLAEWIAQQQPPPEYTAGVRRALLRVRQHTERCLRTLLESWERWEAEHIPHEIVGLSQRWVESFGSEAVDPEYAPARVKAFLCEQIAALQSPIASSEVRFGRVRALQEACELLAPLGLSLECPSDLAAQYATLDTQRYKEIASGLLTALLERERESTQQHAGSSRGFGRVRKGWEWLIAQLESETA